MPHNILTQLPATKLLVLWVLLTFSDTSETQKPWEIDSNLPSDVKPSFYAVSLYADLDNNGYSGNVSIHITVTAEKKYMWLHHFHNKINHVVVMTSTMVEIEVDQIFTFDQNGFFIIEFKDIIPPGEYKLQIQYDGIIYTHFYFPDQFYLDYYSENIKRRLVFSIQTFPLFAQLNFRAVFEMQITYPNEEYAVISNTVYESVKQDSPTTGVTTVKFKDTPVISPLITFLASSLDSLPIRNAVNNIVVVLRARTEALNLVTRNLEEIVFSLKFYSEYFNFRLPIEKLDVIVAPPNLNFGIYDAFTYWGIIIIKEAAATYERGVTAGFNEFNDARTAAHEVCHLIISLIVGATYYSDLFLYESTVSYLQYRTVKALYNHWDVLSFTISECYYLGMREDAYIDGSPLVPAVPTNVINKLTRFNVYYKGAAMFRMIECFMGKANLDLGFKDFVSKFAYSSATINNLWDSLQPYALNINITRVMDTWTKQNTFPLVTLTRRDNQLILTQDRFMVSKSIVYNKSESDYNFRWVIPMNGKGNNGFELNTTLWLKWDQDNLTIRIPPYVKWVKININQCYFYRVNYDKGMWDLFARILEYDMTTFDGIERGNFLDDAFALAEAGYLPVSFALNLTRYMHKEDQYLPFYTVFSIHLPLFETIMTGTPGYEYYRRYFSRLLGPHMKYISWKLISPDFQPVKRLHHILILRRACHFRVKSCLDTAKYMFYKWLLHCGTKPIPEIAGQIFLYGMLQSGVDEWNLFWEKYLNLTDEKERSLYREPLCQIRDPSIISFMLNEAPRDELVYFFDACSHNPVAVPVMWDYLRQNSEYLANNYLPSFKNITETVTKSFFEYEEEVEVKDFFSGISETVLDLPFRKNIIGKIRYNRYLKYTYGPDITAWFEEALRR